MTSSEKHSLPFYNFDNMKDFVQFVALLSDEPTWYVGATYL